MIQSQLNSVIPGTVHLILAEQFRLGGVGRVE